MLKVLHGIIDNKPLFLRVYYHSTVLLKISSKAMLKATVLLATTQ